MSKTLTPHRRLRAQIVPSVRTTLPRLLPLRWIAVWRERQALVALDADALADIGVSREAAEAEARRPFWDIPEGR